MRRGLYGAFHKSMVNKVVECVTLKSLTCHNGFYTGCVPPHLSEELIREQFFENENKLKLFQRFLEVNSDIKIPAKEAAASVFMPLCIVDNHLSLLYTIRTSNLPTHKGKVCFPGGLASSADTSLVDAALREAYEELGISKHQIDIWGLSAEYPDQSLRYNVKAVLGNLGKLDLKTLNINKKEVNEVFTLPIHHLLNVRNHGYTTYKFGVTMPVFLNSHQNIWGLTAILTDSLLTAAFPHLHKKIFEQFDAELVLNPSH
ncbi:mitochondrial coenzyme A diphosphatase NUDT8-like [Hydractinia symbiolongicarpus]|uniref:mitochondrial coenzyme A diphosphatase NUDT8-like n=1 Tax=Hydractinia symbiolongicarpus TaxID=13093 RepID=UPI00254F7D60|nr:mitochondrial coenzyme A diphosphatase NUDT8-like [Hydractinia symbiolongicarpus]